MISLSYSKPAFDTLIAEIKSDIQVSAKRGLKSAAEPIPDMIRATFVNVGERGGNPAWPKLTLHSIQYRQTWPASGTQDDKLAYFRAHKPLFDTGALFQDFQSGQVQAGELGYAVIVTAPNSPYGSGHDDGTGKTPDGQPVRKRPHMFIVVGEDTDVIDGRFESAFAGGSE